MIMQYKDVLKNFKKETQIHFKNEELLLMALTHCSFPCNKRNLQDNQRLELLGDSVLGLIVTEHLYNKHQEYQEGKITKIKNYIVSQPVLSRFARKLNLGQYLIMSPSEEASGGRDKDSSLADALEALLGAIYLDQGYQHSVNIFIPIMEQECTECTETFISDYKSEVQYIVQKKLKKCPDYNVIHECGPNHCKVFTVGIFINDICYAHGEAKSKKEAEQQAAKIVFEKIQEGEITI